MMSISALRKLGILGINRRNADYTLRWNERHRYPSVDDKLITKALCERAHIPVPTLYAKVETHHDAQRLPRLLLDFPSFVIKPARGAMGNGILVLYWEGDQLFRGGKPYAKEDLIYHAAGIVSGLYSLAGAVDIAMIEERLIVDVSFDALVYGGVPDIRVIVYRGIPVMAMVRLPTEVSAGRANLHQGAIGAGIHLATGRLGNAIQRGKPIEKIPHNDIQIAGFQIQRFTEVLETAVKATDQTGLGYVGADVVLDAQKGPVILELNARPGLAIQMANGQGLRPRLDRVDQWHEKQGTMDAPLSERIAFGQSLAHGENA